MEQEEYNNEAINWQHIEFVDNQENRVSIFNFKNFLMRFALWMELFLICVLYGAFSDLRFEWSFFWFALCMELFLICTLYEAFSDLSFVWSFFLFALCKFVGSLFWFELCMELFLIWALYGAFSERLTLEHFLFVQLKITARKFAFSAIIGWAVTFWSHVKYMGRIDFDRSDVYFEQRSQQTELIDWLFNN